MKLQLIAVGARPPRWAQLAYDEYAKRLPNHLRLESRLIPPPKGRRRAADAKASEGDAIIAAITASSHVVALDQHGSGWSSKDLANNLAAWQRHGRDVALVIGGAEGLADAVTTRAGQRWSLGPATFPHAMVRVMVAEQIYRAWSILENHPYHRE